MLSRGEEGKQSMVGMKIVLCDAVCLTQAPFCLDNLDACIFSERPPHTLPALNYAKIVILRHLKAVLDEDTELSVASFSLK